MSPTTSSPRNIALTEPDSLAERIDVDPEERGQARGKQQIEARDPSANNGALLQTLLCELATRSVSRRRSGAERRTIRSRDVRRDGHERLHARVLEDGERDDDPERDREALHRAHAEGRAVDMPDVPLAARVVGDVVVRAEISVEDDNGDGAEERE